MIVFHLTILLFPQIEILVFRLTDPISPQLWMKILRTVPNNLIFPWMENLVFRLTILIFPRWRSQYSALQFYFPQMEILVFRLTILFSLDGDPCIPPYNSIFPRSRSLCSALQFYFLPIAIDGDPCVPPNNSIFCLQLQMEILIFRLTILFFVYSYRWRPLYSALQFYFLPIAIDGDHCVPPNNSIFCLQLQMEILVFRLTILFFAYSYRWRSLFSALQFDFLPIAIDGDPSIPPYNIQIFPRLEILVFRLTDDLFSLDR